MIAMHKLCSQGAAEVEAHSSLVGSSSLAGRPLDIMQGFPQVTPLCLESVHLLLESAPHAFQRLHSVQPSQHESGLIPPMSARPQTLYV